MQKDQVKILIVDDDPSFGKACTKIVEKMGYTVYVAKTPEDAIQFCSVNSFQIILVDCMLPKTPGIDLCAKLIELSPEATVALMSGIYKDKAFIRQAKQKSGASEFLIKPFGKDVLENFVNSHLTHLVEDAQAPIPRLFGAQSVRKRKIVEAIEESENIHGFELPFIYSLFVNARISGQMNIVEATGDIFGVTFAKGKVVGVDTNDPPSQLGEILVEKGLLEREDIEFEMAKATVKKIGERLVSANLLSPHILDEVLVEQMEIRLTKTVMDSSIEVNFVEADEIPDSPGIETHNFAFLLDRWIEQKITKLWLKNYYLSWMDHQVSQGSYFKEDHDLLDSPAFSQKPNFVTDLMEAGSIQSLINKKTYLEDEILACTHYLAITKFIKFDQASQARDFNVHLVRLQKLHKEFKEKNHFEILNVSKNAKGSEIQRAYQDMVKVLDPTKMGADAPPEVVELNKTLFDMVNTSYQAVGEEENRAIYMQQLKEVDAKKILMAENLIEQGKQLLTGGQASQALAKFNEAYEMNKESLDLLGYRIWARLKLISPARKEEELRELERDISEISQQARQSALFHFVKGLFQKERGNHSLAKSHIENAISIDPDFLEARRELNVLKLKQKQDQPVDLLRSDLKDVVGMLFKRK